MKKLILLIIFLLLPWWVGAANIYWVSPTGAASWANAQSDTPLSGAACTTVALAFANATAGRTVNFRSGTYVFPECSGDSYHGTYTLTNSGTGDADANRVIFKAYTGESVTFQGTSYTGSHAEGGQDDGTATMFLINANYITLDGFKFVAYDRVIPTTHGLPRIYNGSHNTSMSVNYTKIINCEFDGGGDFTAASDNVSFIRNEGNSETYANNHLIISNCYFHDLTAPTNVDGMQCYESYKATDTKIEYCTFYNTLCDIMDKTQGLRNNYQYNFFLTGPTHNTMAVLRMTPGNGTYREKDSLFHNNVIVLTSGSNKNVWEVARTSLPTPLMIDNCSVYNNTIYNATGKASDHGLVTNISGDPSQFSLWNNIIYNVSSSTVYMMRWASAEDPTLLYPLYLDYNDYYSSAGSQDWTGTVCASMPKTSLTAWKACGWETNSISTNPGIINPGGTTAADYKRSSYTQNGRGGSYDSVMGAYITGNETIGYTAGGGGDIQNPVCTITTPADDPHDNGSTSTITVSGTASDNVGVTSVTWANDRGGSGTCTGTTAWSQSGITLSSGSNVITITAHDVAANVGTDTITVIYTPATKCFYGGSQVSGGGGVR